ncbi:MAG: hypothetical protein FRX49_10275 [Trebouxia sp. A1-2]|nr:MAG: hypothetical protein FRX49_10275 [Trebouxia sp. A1-2]
MVLTSKDSSGLPSIAGVLGYSQVSYEEAGQVLCLIEEEEALHTVDEAAHWHLQLDAGTYGTYALTLCIVSRSWEVDAESIAAAFFLLLGGRFLVMKERPMSSWSEACPRNMAYNMPVRV